MHPRVDPGYQHHGHNDECSNYSDRKAYGKVDLVSKFYSYIVPKASSSLIHYPPVNYAYLPQHHVRAQCSG